MSTPEDAAAYISPGERIVTKAEERRVIVASSVGTVFEWYDFYLYATLAPFFASLFFPKGNDTAAFFTQHVERHRNRGTGLAARQGRSGQPGFARAAALSAHRQACHLSLPARRAVTARPVRL